MSRRVVVTGLGCITPLGTTLKQSWSNLLASKSGVVPITSLPNYKSDYEQFANSVPPTVVVGKIPELQEQVGLVTDQDARRVSDFTKLAILASHEALSHADLLEKRSGDEVSIDQSKANLYRFGCVIGTGIASIQDFYSTSVSFHNDRKRVNPVFVPKILTNMAAGNVSIKFNLKGVSHCASTACATGNNSIGDAFNFIRLGMADVCLAGASESCIHPLSLAGFIRTKSITVDDGVSRPFDAKRSGFVLGEGAGMLVLESLENAERRGADILAEIVGYGLSSDAFHITSPCSDGNGAMRAIQMALDMGKVNTEQIGYVNAHATSTVLGDRAESIAIKSALLPGPRSGLDGNLLFVSSNKGAIGHLLGAAGAVESIFTIMSLKDEIMPHTLNLENISGAKGDNYEKDFSGITFIKDKPIVNPNLEYALCNSFGFGGVNTSLLFKKWVK
ncbi:hypothetical protein HG535_0F03750 [Zygotorulaspora mrakii]|uniref:beta-ketoacyl-[acyl-carrier-protein] synthase I n=1 Tax=Zygotorulaspora mrakii TaxID=42260 RepID=A0A7H9B6C4_ZYGMR|nr:uncharacterized protein HG535_0F03750 [Zygotorulaspora mrakii]QLG73864.1 hypothetical protein HG535_0F03750 [Zygotorulaspora mrakii]